MNFADCRRSIPDSLSHLKISHGAHRRFVLLGLIKIDSQSFFEKIIGK